VSEHVAYVGAVQLVPEGVLAGLLKIAPGDLQALQPAKLVADVSPSPEGIDVTLRCDYGGDKRATLVLEVEGAVGARAVDSGNGADMNDHDVAHGVYIDSGPLDDQAYAVTVLSFSQS
jgi:hypothetical protein